MVVSVFILVWILWLPFNKLDHMNHFYQVLFQLIFSFLYQKKPFFTAGKELTEEDTRSKLMERNQRKESKDLTHYAYISSNFFYPPLLLKGPRWLTKLWLQSISSIKITPINSSSKIQQMAHSANKYKWFSRAKILTQHSVKENWLALCCKGCLIRCFPQCLGKTAPQQLGKNCHKLRKVTYLTGGTLTLESWYPKNLANL